MFAFKCLNDSLIWTNRPIAGHFARPFASIPVNHVPGYPKFSEGRSFRTVQHNHGTPGTTNITASFVPNAPSLPKGELKMEIRPEVCVLGASDNFVTFDCTTSGLQIMVTATVRRLNSNAELHSSRNRCISRRFILEQKMAAWIVTCERWRLAGVFRIYF